MPSLADSLREAPFELIMSSGFFGFFAHAGFVRAVEEAGLQPSLVGGSSAGALVAGLWGAGMAAGEIRDRLFALKREDFWDPDPLFGLRRRAGLGLLRGERFARLLDDALGAAGARRFERCRVPVRVLAFDVAERRTVALDGGELGPALRASCSVPGMFQPVVIDGRRYLDGGIADRAGLGAASPSARVLHHELPMHSPWRRVMPRQRRSSRDGLVVLTEPSLPRLSPFHLHRGPRAFELAREMATRALAAPPR